MLGEVEPKVCIVSRPEVDWHSLYKYLYEVHGEEWGISREQGAAQRTSPGEILIEFAGRMCYRSWKPGLNKNVTRIRDDRAQYLRNILESGHGSVLEHVSYTFVFRHISRVVTHELVRHRVGTAISQESMRYVRLDHIPFWFPDWAQEDHELMDRCGEMLEMMQEWQLWMAEHFGLDDEGTPFREKKAKTSFMRRFAPEGVATDMTWTANVRTLRHVIEKRTDPSAEEEIRLVFGQVARLMKEECPVLFGDMEKQNDGSWIPAWRKV